MELKQLVKSDCQSKSSAKTHPYMCASNEEFIKI